jgi:putative colanic acid biosynthesis UDP-glucose lipid carrier transferase
MEHILEARHLLREAERQCVRLKFIPLFADVATHVHMRVDYMAEFPVISIRKEPLEDTGNRLRKRIFDIAFSLFVIIFIMSWFYPLIALLIKWQDRGPVLFKQLRSGRDNMPFVCYKFRSMRINTQSDTLQATEKDERITRLGKFLRKSSLDELPQFFNVLKGEMSVVGPRPHMLKHTKEYGKVIDSFMMRHFLKPGITGWAQVNGYRGKTSNPIQMRKRVASDIWYLENWSTMLDVKIIFLTIINVFKGEENAY